MARTVLALVLVLVLAGCGSFGANANATDDAGTDAPTPIDGGDASPIDGGQDAGPVTPIDLTAKMVECKAITASSCPANASCATFESGSTLSDWTLVSNNGAINIQGDPFRSGQSASVVVSGGGGNATIARTKLIGPTPDHWTVCLAFDVAMQTFPMNSDKGPFPRIELSGKPGPGGTGSTSYRIGPSTDADGKLYLRQYEYFDPKSTTPTTTVASSDGKVASKLLATGSWYRVTMVIGTAGAGDPGQVLLDLDGTAVPSVPVASLSSWPALTVFAGSAATNATFTYFLDNFVFAYEALPY